jgi:hypothetical protein
MGRIHVEMSGEKEGRQENAAVMAVILAKNIDDNDDDDSSMHSSSESNSSNNRSSGEEEEDDDDENCLARIVVLIANHSHIFAPRGGASRHLHEQNRLGWLHHRRAIKTATSGSLSRECSIGQSGTRLSVSRNW